MSTVVRADRLTKDFSTGFWRPRPKRALDALSLEIPQGGVFGLLGPNGAGKSTTLKLLINLIWPTSGTAEIFGKPAGDVEARRRLGFLPEHPTFYDYLSADELVSYFAGLFGYRGADRARARHARARSRRAWAPTIAGARSGSTRRGWCSASASRRRSSTIPSS